MGNECEIHLVTGATGFVGRHLVKALLRNGERVYALCRSTSSYEKLKEEYSNLFLIQGSLEKDSVNCWVEKLRGMNLTNVIHVAGLVHAHRVQDFYDVNTLGTQFLLEGLKKVCLKNRPLKFVLISSLAAAGPYLKDGEKKNSDKSLMGGDGRPVSHYGKSKLDAERFLRNFEMENLDKAIVRPPIVMGPEDKAFLPIFETLRKGVWPIPGHQDKYYNFVHIEDLVNFLCLLIEGKRGEKESLRVPIFYVNHPEVISYKQMGETIHDLLGREKKLIILPVPASLFRFLGYSSSLISRLFKINLPLTRDKCDEILAYNWICKSERAEEMGYTFKKKFTETVQDTLEYYQKNVII